MAQFSRFIRPGFQILSTGDGNSLAAYDATNRELVIITVNDSKRTFQVVYDLNAFSQAGSSAQMYRTSPGEGMTSVGTIPIAGKRLVSEIPPWSVTTQVITNISAGMNPVSVNDNTTGNAMNQFTYAGHWNYYAAQAGAWQNDNHWSVTAGDSYRVRFAGTAIRLHAAKDRICGIGAVSVDGAGETLVDFYSPTRADDAIVWMSPSLTPGPHILQVRVTGEKNPLSHGIAIPVDRVVFVRNPP
jgi:hypothetical protein